MNTTNEKIHKTINDLKLEKMDGFQSWAYEGDSYKDKEGNMYCLINGADNDDIENIPKDTHLYKVETGDIEDEVSFRLIV